MISLSDIQKVLSEVDSKATIKSMTIKDDQQKNERTILVEYKSPIPQSGFRLSKKKEAGFFLTLISISLLLIILYAVGLENNKDYFWLIVFLPIGYGVVFYTYFSTYLIGNEKLKKWSDFATLASGLFTALIAMTKAFGFETPTFSFFDDLSFINISFDLISTLFLFLLALTFTTFSTIKLFYAFSALKH